MRYTNSTSVRVYGLFAAFSLLFAGCSPQGLDGTSTEPTVLIESGWAFREGDSPLAADGGYIWLDDSSTDEAWTEVETPTRRHNPLNAEFLWLRIQLPSGSWKTPSIHFASLFTAADVFVGDRPLGRLGVMEPVRDRSYSQNDWRVVALPADAPGKTLYLRVFSYDHVLAGVSANRIWFGDYDNLVRRAVHHQLDQFMLGVTLTLVGFASIALWIKRREPLYGSFGLFVASIGAFLTLINSASRYFLDFLPYRVYLGYVSFLLVPIGLFVYYETITRDYRRAARRLWKFHLWFAVTSVGCDLAGFISLQGMMNLAQAILAVELVALLVMSAKSAKRGDEASSLFNIGFAVLGATAMHDLFVSFGWLPDWRHLLAWGVFGFVAFLGYLVERRFNENVAALEESNALLEQRVGERTRDLNQKNRALEGAMVQLRETQQQLVVQEKMASLGNLVAGIAHEINTPVGAVASSADTSARSLRMIEHYLEGESESRGVAADEDLRKAVRVLSDNQKVIATASSRIDTIVRGLRNFARLDNSELMEVDLHEGLDSSLALVQHELKGRIEVVRDYGELPRVRCYPSRLNQVFMNLLVNAAQAIGAAGTIRIRTGAASSEVFVEIEDDGCGIEPAALDRIFDPGFTTKGVGVGTGLGLAISYQIVRDHGGRIDVDSTSGKGSIFRVTVPARAPLRAADVPTVQSVSE